MKIIACIKQVPQGETQMDLSSGIIIRTQGERMINPHDEAALELAMTLRDMTPSSTASALSMGPEFISEMLCKTLAAGINNACQMSDILFAGADVLATAKTLSLGIKHIGVPDVIVCGEHTTDGGTGHTGALLASLLGFEYIACVSKIESISNNIITLRRENESEGKILLCEVRLPCLLTAKSSAFPLRLPTLKSKLASKKIPIVNITAQDLSETSASEFGFAGSKTKVIKLTKVKKPTKLNFEQFSNESSAEVIFKTIRERVYK